MGRGGGSVTAQLAPALRVLIRLGRIVTCPDRTLEELASAGLAGVQDGLITRAELHPVRVLGGELNSCGGATFTWSWNTSGRL